MRNESPSYQTGFAPRDDEPLYPELWRGCVGAWSPALGPSGLVLRDWSGCANHGSLTNGATWVPSGGRWASNFDGTDDYVLTPSSLPNIGPAFSYSVWIRPDFDSSHTTGRAIISADGANRIYLRWEGPSLGFYLDSTSVAFRTTVAPSFAAGEWHHLVFACNGQNTNGTIYFDGTAVASTIVNIGPFPDTTGYSLRIGFGSANSYYWDGGLDDVRIYNRPLRDEVKLLRLRPNIAYELAPIRRAGESASAYRRRLQQAQLIGGGTL